MIYLLYFLLVVFAVILFVLFCPVVVYIDLNSSVLNLKFKIFGIPINISNTKKKKKKSTAEAKKSKSSTKKSENTKKKIETTETEKTKTQKTDIISMLEFLSEILPELGKLMGKFGKSVVISELEIFILMHNEDAAKLGKKVAYTNALLSSMQYLIANAFTLKDYKVLASGSYGIDYSNTVVQAKIFVVPIVPIFAALKFGLFAFNQYNDRISKSKAKKKIKN